MSRSPHSRDVLSYRIWYLPRQLEAARRKVAALENEARRYGMHELVSGCSPSDPGTCAIGAE